VNISILIAIAAVAVAWVSPVSAAWTRVGTGLLDTNITPLVANGSSIYAGGYEGLYRSDDSGANWTKLNPSGINSGISSNPITMAVDGAKLFVGTLFNGLFLSVDSGKTWTKAPTIPANCTIQALVLSGGKVFVGTGSGGGGTARGFYVSTDTGATFAAADTGLANLDISCLLLDGNDLYAGTAGGLFLSANDGATWSEIDSGFFSKKITALAKLGSNLYAATRSGSALYMTTGKGAKWNIVGSATLNGNKAVSTLAVRGDYLYAGTGGNGLYASGDRGGTWKQYMDGLTQGNVAGVLLLGDRILISTTEDGGVKGKGIFGRPLSELEAPVFLRPSLKRVQAKRSVSGLSDAAGRALGGKHVSPAFHLPIR
jgi:hypothetical protein